MSPLALLLLPGLPALGALVLALAGRQLPRPVVAGVACAAVGAPFALALGFASAVGQGQALSLDLGPWVSTAAFSAGWAFRLDTVAFAMVLLVTSFGTLVTLYSVGYMQDDPEPARFFASLNLFVASMLVLLLADNLLLIFLGWEGVGLCSYLLIGHHWRERAVPPAAYRAFFANRIGDLSFVLGVFFLFAHFGSFEIEAIADAAARPGFTPDALAFWGALLLLGGAFAKSAQAPLHVWLPDAMAGPTPVSALIHAATMVTAGIYLVARLAPLYALFPVVRGVIFLCALMTLVVGAVLAVVQYDIKRILAYSTLSNLALMFLALAAGSPGAARLHLFGHASFKALLFLAAGSVIVAAHHEQDVRKLAGVLKHLPITRAAFWIGSVGAAGLLPFLSASFFSKELVLEAVGESQLQLGHLSLSGPALVRIITGVEFLSAIYVFRLLGYLESNVPGEAAQGHHGHVPNEHHLSIKLVLCVLCFVGLGFGFVSAPSNFGGSGAGLFGLINGPDAGALPLGPTWLHALPAMTIGTLVAVATFMAFAKEARRNALLQRMPRISSRGLLARNFLFDAFYESAIFLPLRALARACSALVEPLAEGALDLMGGTGEVISGFGRRLMTGKFQHYAAFLFLAVLLVLLLLPGS